MLLLCQAAPRLFAQAALGSNLSPSPGYVSQAAYQQPAVAPAGNADALRPPPSLDRSRAAESPLPLKPRAATGNDDAKRQGGLQTLLTVGGSLAIVLGLFLGIVWTLRKAAPGGLAPLPPEVFEVLGRASLANRQQVQLVRCGNKLLLVSTGGAGGNTSTLTEISDPDEVEQIIAFLRNRRSAGSSASRTSRERENRNA